MSAEGKVNHVERYFQLVQIFVNITRVGWQIEIINILHPTKSLIIYIYIYIQITTDDWSSMKQFV